PLRLDIETLLCPLNHRLRRADLRLADGTRRFDIQDDANLHIDQIIIGRCKKCWSPHRAGPLGGGIRRRDELRRYLGGSAKSCVVEGCPLLLTSSACGLRIALLDPLRAWDRPLLVGVRHDQARIDRKLLTTDQSRRNTCLNHTLKAPAKNVVVTEPLIAASREHRMVRNLVFDAKAAKPAVRQIDP